MMVDRNDPAPENIEPDDSGFQPLPQNAPKLEERPAVLPVDATAATSRKFRGYTRAKALGILLAVGATVTVILILANNASPLDILQAFIANLFASLLR